MTARWFDSTAVILAGLPKAILPVLNLAGKTRLGSKRRRNAELEIARASALFDDDWYLQAYPDVARAGMDPLIHYMTVGWREGRDPSSHFATSAYLKSNPDVARAYVNPLLHYIEFGHSEGRGTFDPPFSARPPVSFEFADPAPCASFPVSGSPTVTWPRSYRLNRHRPDAVAIGEQVIGYSDRAAPRTESQAGFELLRQISGFGRARPGRDRTKLPQSEERLLDAWYVNSTQLRTRWRSERLPLVVRAFQHDPTPEGKLSLVGEGLVTSPIDFIDLHLGNPFFPILFVFADADGVLRGSALLTFPSLSRGGAHYPELLSSGSCAGANSGMDLFSVSDGLTKRLIRLIEREDVPTITAVQVALSGGSGTSLLFQPDFQLWLEKVAQVSVVARSADPNSGAEQFLGEEVVVRPVRGRDLDGAALILGCDMIPTIASLVELRRPSSAVASQTLLPLLIPGADPSQPAACIDLPGEMPEQILIENAVRWPQLKRIGTAPLPASFPPAAILRQSGRSLTDAELFIPVTKGEPTGGASGRPAISWLIETTDCAAQDLRRTLETLALQNGGSADSIIFVGPIARNILAGTRDWFATVKRFPSLSGAVASIETPLAGVIASGILLHNDRTADLFSELLESDAVATASCALISVPTGSWHVSIADLGAIHAADGSRLGRSERAHAAEHLWRCNYPVATPSRQLWVARSGCVAGWSADASRCDVTVGMHLCSALVTASYVAAKKPPLGQSFVPQAQQDQVTKVELLFG